jgi:putative restriction endonuclease
MRKNCPDRLIRRSRHLVNGRGGGYSPGSSRGVRPLIDAPDLAHLDRDWQIRIAAMNALRARVAPTGGLISRPEMTAGFDFVGERIAFANRQVGIWRPRQLAPWPGVALSITTAAARPGVIPKYNDDVGSDGWFAYRYQGADPRAWDNTAVRAAFEHGRPLIYFYGVAPGLYEALFPVYVVADDPATLTFSVAHDTVGLGEQTLITGGSAVPLKDYATRVVKQRLHQRRFRELVIQAYQRKCAVCTLGTNDRLLKLLDAAHIIADRDVRGQPEIPNGLSLCKIHHSAYDLNILGIDADTRIHIRDDILAQVDGPMLQHGIKGMDGVKLRLPRRTDQQPRPDYLAERFELFRAA